MLSLGTLSGSVSLLFQRRLQLLHSPLWLVARRLALLHFVAHSPPLPFLSLCGHLEQMFCLHVPVALDLQRVGQSFDLVLRRGDVRLKLVQLLVALRFTCSQCERAADCASSARVMPATYSSKLWMRASFRAALACRLATCIDSRRARSEANRSLAVVPETQAHLRPRASLTERHHPDSRASPL